MVSKKRPQLSFLLVFVLAIVLVLPGSSAFAASGISKFGDVPTNNMDQVSWAINQGIVSGYQDGTFQPWKPIDRAHAAIMIANALNLPVPKSVSASPFKDVSVNDTYAGFIKAVSDANIFKGDQNGNFNPDQTLTREQMATVLVKAFGLKDNGVNEHVNDMGSVGSSHRANVQILADLGITKLQNGKFNPGVANTRLNLVSFLYQVDQFLNGTPAPAPTDTTPPKLISVSSKLSSPTMPLDLIYLTFDEPVTVDGEMLLTCTSGTDNDTVITVKNFSTGADLDGNGSIEGATEENTLVLYQDLDPKSSYSLDIYPSTVTDLNGNANTEHLIQSFTTN